MTPSGHSDGPRESLSGGSVVERQYECPNEHLWMARGENHWNPWGPPDWAALSSAEVTCPTCGRRGSPRRNVGSGLITPDGTLYV